MCHTKTGWESWICSAVRREGWVGTLWGYYCWFHLPNEGCREDRARCFSEVCRKKDERQQTQVITRKISITYKVHNDSDRKLEQVSWKVCRVSVIGDTQNFPGQGIKQPSQTSKPAVLWAKTWTSVPTKVIIQAKLFCDSVVWVLKTVWTFWLVGCRHVSATDPF